MTGSKNAETGKALIGSLRSPEAAAVFRSKGLDPRQTVAGSVGLPTAK
jgi:ABC-type molybdate transport system substrate-binding protein